ncbi:cell cycle checkpoint control protein RAD9A isoform X2 [Zootermopsis nevadensis]|uniref:cell cycle checkpoint control protein RAD9A isoform X2 n=1 Tax=Zootermopsis nevadensis TaxID=136037 RepID=UPI000B8E44AD|nr:cell cycle checkpoint control protein RAD9A isoform X2 [Zootermopsis nevadensis]
MKCVIPGPNVKVLARAIHALCRIGDELYVEPEPAKLSFRAVSASKSAYASFSFSESFFSYYNYEQTKSQEEDVTCKVSMKSCVAVFRSPTHLDKQVEACQIRLEPDGVKLIFEFHCHHGIIKTHYLPIIECETLEAVYSKDMVPNRLVVQPKLLTFAVMNFQANTLELTLVVTPQKMQLRNYAEDENEMKKTVRTELCLEPGEFDHYSIGVDTSVTFCLREFRALLLFAEAVNLPVAASFETGGRPIVFVVKNAPTFESNFVFATLMPMANNQLNTSQQSYETVPHTSRAKTGTSTKNCDTAHTACKRILSPIHATENSIHTPAAGPSRRCNSSKEHGSQSMTENVSELLPRLRMQEDCVQDNGNTRDAENTAGEDAVPGTPPLPAAKKARYIFSRCFEATFNSQMLPGYDEVLAEDSDDESNKRT